MASPGTEGGRVNQKLRTRRAIVQAAAELSESGRDVNMAEIAKAALVSEATAYRYFPDLSSLLEEAIVGYVPSPEDALRSVAQSGDVVERVAAATEYLLRHVLRRQGVVRAMIAGTITRPERSTRRPGLRFGLIDYALSPLTDGSAALGAEALEQLRRDLSVVVSAEALFSLTDLYGLPPEEAVASLVRTATSLARASLEKCDAPAARPRRRLTAPRDRAAD
ncbi:TetR/AcrR family transcriptional regulator [Actinacidiphila acididurans]|uniref:TetR/AcrR family transcriptional regulator n=1 Tax=Actinacidiphila acididurans TaxID=2784346 RepID=A0ABS2TLK8_9ACTN|nr:TetR/AcrR family transcriptional regulator [Actinacidiphila acididurans]MBM9504225.1 TetR/AcrR family transcriptional regulator [Actinacidiphila acididurans]